MWHGAHPGQKPTPEGAWLLRYSRVHDPDPIPRADLQAGPRPVVPPEGDTDLWDLCGAGMLAGVDALTRASDEQDTADEDLGQLLPQLQGDMRDDVEPCEGALDAWAQLRRWWPSLPEREAEVLRLRYLEGLTLGDAGWAMREPVTRERVRQIEARAINRLRKLAGAVGVIEAVERAQRQAQRHDDCPYFRRVYHDHRPGGPDGQGRNRLRLEDAGPWLPDRCLLRPTDPQTLWEGLERPGHAEPTLFGLCDHAARHVRCIRLVRTDLARGAYPATCVRMLGDGKPWLLNRPDRGWGEYGHPLRSLDRAAEALALARGALRWRRDEHGELVEVVADRLRALGRGW